MAATAPPTGLAHPPLLWAQTLTTVLLTVAVPDAQDVRINVKDNCLSVACAAPGGKQMQCEVPLFATVVPEDSSHSVRPRHIEVVLRKASPAADASASGFWPRLTLSKAKSAFIQIDWSRWKDEDDLIAGSKDGGAGAPSGGGADDGMDFTNFSELQAMMGGAGGAFGGQGFGSHAGQQAQGIHGVDDEDDEDTPPPLE